MRIVIIGTGNTATVLGRKLKAAGHEIVQIFGRDTMAASKLAYELDTESTNYWNVVDRTADLYLLAVSDTAIEEVIQELQLPGKMVVHTAAAVPKEVLKGVTSRYGVLYPLQSLKKEAVFLPEVPLLIDAGDPVTLRQLEILAASISDQVLPAGDEQRLKLHVAAVFCNNFVNHLYALTEQYCKKEAIDFTLLLPLIEETALSLQALSPAAAQTGPTRRNDQATIEKHRQLLDRHPQMAALYETLTRSIQGFYGV